MHTVVFNRLMDHTEWRMAISIDDIRMDWLGDGQLASSPSEVVDAFSRLEAMLGVEWMAGRKRLGMVGPGVAIPLFEIGRQLEVLERARNRDALVQRLRENQAAAFSELTSLARCAGADRSIEIEIEPAVSVGDGQRLPDFRLRRNSDPWVYVEVTQPNMSDAQMEVMRIGQAIAQSLMGVVPIAQTVEVRWRRDPSIEDRARVIDATKNALGERIVDLDWAVLPIAVHTGVITPNGADELGRPIVGTAVAEIGPNGGRSVSVRIPFTDERAQRILDAEAKQLPKAGPNLVCMVQVLHPGWVPLIQRSFSPMIRTRVSAVLLLNGGIMLGPDGLISERSWGRLVENPRARAQLPTWLAAPLRSVPNGP